MQKTLEILFCIVAGLFWLFILILYIVIAGPFMLADWLFKKSSHF